MNLGGGLTGLVGAGGQGGAFSPQAQQDQQKKQMLAQLFQAIQKSKQQQGQQGQGAPSALPGSPQGQGGPAGDLPSMDQMINQLIASPGNNATKMQALEQYGAFASPFEKMQVQLTMQSQKLEAAQQRLDDQMKNMQLIQTMKNSQSGANNAATNATRERGQDISSTNTDKRVGATERGQDMRSDTSWAALEEKQRHETTMENIASVSAENKKPFMAARDTYNKAASLYQSLTRPGATPAASAEDIAFAKDKMDKAQATMTKLAGSGGSAAQLPDGVKPEDITPENLEHTAKVNGITVDEVKKRLGVQ